MQKIGIFGGTFAPFHIGHLTIVKCFIEQCELDKCYIVPNKCSPFKTDVDILHSNAKRLEIIEKNIIDIHNMELCLYELNNEVEISYSIDTIKYFREIYTAADLFLLIGNDVALHFGKWKNYEEILEMVKIVIAARDDKHNEDNNKQLDKIFGVWGYILLENPIVDISSTAIRTIKTDNKKCSQ